MNRLLKRLLLLVSTLGLGALAYALMRAEGERVLRPASPANEEGEEPRPRPAPRPDAAAPRAVEVEVARCAGVTKGGKRCVREALPGSQYCWQHA